MHSFNNAFYLLKNKLTAVYDANEATAIAHELLLHVTGLDKMQRLMQKDTLFTDTQQAMFLAALAELEKGKPIQQVTGIAWFKGQPYMVNEHVLIPRPETEELVDWVLHDLPTLNQPVPLLDIGTGSGCIPISIKLNAPHTNVLSVDISPKAIETAKINALFLQAAIELKELNFLDPVAQNNLGMFSVIVSNPPYIPLSEKQNLHTNVREFEPALALFVPDADPLLFYRAIATFGREHLSPGGAIYCELDANHATHTASLFEEMKYKNVEIRKDIFGNNRMLKAII